MKTPPHAPRLRDYGRVLAGSWAVILCAAVLSAVAGWAVYDKRDPVYTADAQVFATVPGAAGTRSAFGGSKDALTRVETYAHIATSSQVLTRTADDLGMSVAQLAGQVTATVEPGTVLLALSVTGDDPDVVRDTANIWTGNLIQVAREIEWNDSPLAPPGPSGELVLVDGAVSTTETRGALSRYLVMGAVLGALVSGALVLARGTRRAEVMTTNQLDHAVREIEQERTS